MRLTSQPQSRADGGSGRAVVSGCEGAGPGEGAGPRRYLLIIVVFNQFILQGQAGSGPVGSVRPAGGSRVRPGPAHLHVKELRVCVC